MLAFREWLLIVEGRVAAVPSSILQSYERAFKDQLGSLIARTQDPRLRAVLTDMLDCPIRSGGGCRSFTDFIVGALIRNGIHHRYDMEGALGYIAEKMLMDRTERGEPRASLFGGFQERPGYAGGNPLLARFLKYLEWAINNIRRGKIIRLGNTETRPQGTVSIGQGRRRDGDPAGTLSPDEVAAPESGEADLGEMVQDVEGLLRRKEADAGFPLVSLFRAIMGGMTLEEQRRRFGDRRVRWARQMIVSTIREYAESSGNAALLHLLARMTGEAPMPTRRMPVPPTRPVLSDRERDYRSIADVIARFDRPVGTADLGRYRRRWLEYPPRDPASGHRNRLEEVLAAMVRDGVLRTTQTRAGATVYSPGPEFGRYQQAAEPG